MNPLLGFDGLADFGAIRPEHVEPAIDRLLADDPSFARSMLAGLSARLHSLLRDVESYSMRSSTQRVIGYLLQQCPDETAGVVEIALPTASTPTALRQCHPGSATQPALCQCWMLRVGSAQ